MGGGLLQGQSVERPLSRELYLVGGHRRTLAGPVRVCLALPRVTGAPGAGGSGRLRRLGGPFPRPVPWGRGNPPGSELVSRISDPSSAGPARLRAGATGLTQGPQPWA